MIRRPIRAPRLILPLRLAAVWLLALVMTPSVFAQGTSGMVPDPITARELARGLTWLQLSPQQLQAVNALHDNYRIEYDALRENEIAEFVEESNELRRNMSWATDRKAVEASTRAYEQLMSRIRRLDDRLFDEIETLVSDDQAQLLSRARQSRERRRYRSGMTRWTAGNNAAAQVDVSTIVLDLELPPDQHATVDPTLAQYERTLTAQVKKLNELSTGLPVESVKRMEALGFAGANPREQPGMWEAMREVWDELYVDINKRNTEISDLNKRTCKSLMVVLPDETSRKLRTEYNVRAYPDIPSTPPRAERSFAAALNLDGLDDEQREGIIALRDQLRRDLDRITDQAIEVVDESRAQRRGMWGGQRNTAAQEALEDLRDRRASAQESSIRALNGLLGADLADRVDRRVATGSTGDGGGDQSGGGGGGAGGTGTVVANTADGMQPDDLDVDPFLPGPITSRVTREYGERLGLGEEMMPLLEGVHDDYMTQYDELARTTIAPLRTARWRLRGSEDAPTTVADVETLFTKRRQALKAILDLDQAFFSEVALVLDDDQAARLDRVRIGRERMTYNRGLDGQSANAIMFGGGSRGGRNSWWARNSTNQEASVDLARIVDGMTLSSEEETAADPVLNEYEQAAASAFRKAYEANLALQQTAWTLKVRGDEAERAGENRWRRIGSEYREMQQTVGENAQQARLRLVELNRGTLASLGTVLPPPASSQLEREYRRLSYTEVYRDARSANALLDATLELDDLTTDQRMMVTEIAGDYRHAYDALCEQMVDIHAEAADAGDEDWSARQERYQRIERVRFDRDELSDKARLRIRAALMENQLQRVGTLADPPVEDLES